MALRVVQWATGSVGVAAINGVLEHPELELVGCWVHSPDKAGRDISELDGIRATGPLGVTTTARIDDILALDADAVIYAPLLPNVDEVTALLRLLGQERRQPRGLVLSGVTPEAAPLERAAREGNATLHNRDRAGAATAVSPAAAGDVHRHNVRAEEFSDLRTYDAPDVLRHVMGFGGTPENALSGPDAKAAQRRLSNPCA